MNINWIRFVTAALLAIVCQGATWAGDVQFTEHLLQAGFGYAYGLAAGDLNGDGKPEITAGDADKGELSGFVNQGTGAFQRFFVRQGEGSWLERHSLGDVDGDGKLDVVIVCNNASKVLWFHNPGNPITTQSWTRNVITQEFPNAYDVALSDFNGDGRLDVAASSYKSNCFAWFENPGSGSAAWSKHILEQNVGETRTICVADFNRDGRPDLLGTSRTGNTVAWYENPTRANTDPWVKHVIDGVSSTPVHGHPVDMNADGELDVVMAFGHLASAEAGQVAWYENPALSR